MRNASTPALTIARACSRPGPSPCSCRSMNNSGRRSVTCGMTASRLLAVLLLLVAPLAWAAPEWQKELTSPKPGNFGRPAPAVLDYQLSWKGAIDSGKVRIEFAPPDVKKPGTYVVRSSSASLGAAAVLFPYQSHFWSELDPVSFRPRFFSAVETDKKETVTTTVRHFPDRVESREITKLTKTGKSKQTDKVFTFTPVFDVFSAMLHVRSQKLDNGDHITLALHPFDTPYLLRVKVVGREMHNGRDAIRLTLGMRKIDRDTMELKPYKKLKQGEYKWPELSATHNDISTDLPATLYARFPILTHPEQVSKLFESDRRFTLGIGNPATRRKLYEKNLDFTAKYLKVFFNYSISILS
ncbi:MAG: DUF3108 domain-containing protein [Cytophagaceae bacterium]|nr:MAG: DUF3108 domain-containing protein [Cytophagaceae bacterium]